MVAAGSGVFAGLFAFILLLAWSKNLCATRRHESPHALPDELWTWAVLTVGSLATFVTAMIINLP